MADNLPPEPDPSVTDVVFVIHGIRDKGFWTQKIGRHIKMEAKGRKFASWTESYGYFAMAPFIFKTVRQRKVEWLMDRYAEARARYPRATFHYVGHSNGTYLCAKALGGDRKPVDYPAARFGHVVFAGSVVRRDYDWRSLIRPGDTPRVGKVLNYVATRDWVVALFPKGMQPWRYFNLGSAGHDGFVQSSVAGPVHEVRYIVGNHGAGHEEPHWNDIARFIVSGQAPAPKPPDYSSIQSGFWRAMGHASVVIFPALVAVILGFGVLLLWSVFAKLPCSVFPYLRDLAWDVCTSDPTARQAAWRTIRFFVYLCLVYLIVTRV